MNEVEVRGQYLPPECHGVEVWRSTKWKAQLQYKYFSTELNKCTQLITLGILTFFVFCHTSIRWFYKLSFSLLNKQTDLTGQHSFILFYCVYMWRTLPPFPASNSVLGTFLLWWQLVYSVMQKKNNIFLSLYYHLINVVTIHFWLWISPKLHSAPLISIITWFLLP